MFKSFFPRPNMFFTSAAAWALFAILFWYFGGKEMGAHFGLPPAAADAAPVVGLGYFVTPDFIWFYIYYFVFSALFTAAWAFIDRNKWFMWSVVASQAIIFVIYYMVQVSVAINNWYGPFYNSIQEALAKTRVVTLDEFYLNIISFFTIASVYIVIAAFNSFFVNHYVFRWRIAMNEYYTSHWHKLRGIEGAAQRVQEDTMRFAKITEGLGSSFIDAIMTLIAFLPVLARLSHQVQDIPILGNIPNGLMIAAILWSLLGTGLLAAVGIRLPGLEFNNQRVEAAFRKELVLGEDDAARAQPVQLATLFDNVRKNYYTLYANYLYFNVARYFYLQSDNIFGMFILAPSIVAAKITLGIMNQVLSAFGQVKESFQYLIRSWPTIIELISIYKRLRAFEENID